MNKSERLICQLAFLVVYFACLSQSSVFINTWNFKNAAESGWEALKRTGSAVDAVVEGCSRCEREQCDGTVGYGGSPDEMGDSALDAMIMDGNSMDVGAVAAMPDIKDAIKVARKVLEHTEHTMLVGEAASSFALSMGFTKTNLSTANSIKLWQEWKKKNCQPNFWKKNLLPDPSKSCGPYKPLNSLYYNNNNKNNNNDNEVYNDKKSPIDKYNHDTIGAVAIDDKGQIVAGTSTNGASFKIPGRVGDSAMTGSGAYADSSVGGAVATGDGDVMMRFLPSFLAVEQMKNGVSPTVACKEAISRIKRFYPKFFGAVLAINKRGDFGAACSGMDRFPFTVMKDGFEGIRLYHVDC